MYGYQPPDQEPAGSWREAWLIIRVAFGVLAPILGALFGAILLLGAALVLFFQSPLLALIPLSVIGAGFWWLARRDREQQELEERRIFGDRPPGPR